MPSLRTITGMLASVVDLVTCSGDLDVNVTEIRLLGEGDAPPDRHDVIYLCPSSGLRPDQTFGYSAAALVIRNAQDGPGSWSESSVPILSVRESVPWHHVHDLLNSALQSRAEPTSSARGDLSQLAETLAAVAGGAVAIENLRREVLAYSSLPSQQVDELRRQSILERRVPALDQNDRDYRVLHRSAGVMRFPYGGDVLPRLAVAVRSGSEVLGTIWIMDANGLGTEAETLLLATAQLAALDFLHLRAGADRTRRARGELLRELFESNKPTELVAHRLGLEDLKMSLLALRLDTGGTDPVRCDAVADLARVLGTAHAAQCAVLEDFETIYVLLADRGLRLSALQKFLHGVAQGSQATLHLSIRGASGPIVDNLDDIAASRDDLDAALDVVPLGACASLEELLPQVVLRRLQLLLKADPRLHLPAINDLISRGAQGTPYAESVLAFLEAGGDIALAAERMNVHANTFRYRLRRIKELFGVDLANPDIRLLAWLQLRTTMTLEPNGSLPA